jgi:TatD DNase family protein
MKLIDSHCHLAMKEFSEDLDAVIERAKDADVSNMVVIGTSPEDWRATLEIARKYKLRSSFALSPHDAKLWNAAAGKELTGMLTDDTVSAVGETGLDYHYHLSSKREQIKSFEEHIKLAESFKLPLIIHSRDSFEDTVSMLKNLKVGVVVHCFTYGVKEAELFLREGFSISFSGIATFKSANEIREACKIVPDEKILLETDSPYLAPEPFRGKRCEPAYVGSTARVLAQLRNINFEEFCSLTAANTEILFGIK